MAAHRTTDSDDDATVDTAVHVCRTVYATVGLGLSRVKRLTISAADAKGADVIDAATEKNALLGAWDAPGNGIDAFNVSISATFSSSRVPGRNTQLEARIVR